MIPEIGLTLLIVSSTLSFILSFITIMGIKLNSEYLLSYTKPLTTLMCLTLISSILSLAYCFLVNDFSVAYVANNSNTQLATLYKVAAVWGSHEGSMLFWVVAIAIWATFIINRAPATDQYFHQKLVAVAALLILGFCLFLLFTSSPFTRLLPGIPIEGRDLNPILQDIGLVIHPPLLFLGYVGLTICFAGAVAALLSGGLSQQYARYLQPWAILAWVFLTGGNAFGSWWAYNELGWGGWWFWDPVENASFIPWLVSTAMVHSILLTAKRGILGSCSIFLAIMAFSLSLLGSFLVRSGVVQSVHAFASDPTRGVSILILLIVFSGSAMALFAQRTSIKAAPMTFSLLSKEGLILFGNMLLVIAAISVLLGTCYPLIFEVISGQTISVGAPYFNSIFIPIAALIFLLMGLAPLQNWQHSAKMRPPLILAAVCMLMALIITLVTRDTFSFWLLLGLFSSLWIISATGLALVQRIAFKDDELGTGKDSSSLRFYAMCFAHLGVAISILGVTLVSNFESEELLRMGPGQGKTLAGYSFIYDETQAVERNSYTAIQAQIRVLDNQNQFVTYLYPQRQTFKTNGMEMSAAGIHSGFLGDLYISMGQKLTNKRGLNDNEYLIRISYKPLVSWIWLGALFMMLSGLVIVLATSKSVAPIPSLTLKYRGHSNELA
ncbi:heme lyase NrfEFG subunit NrfE [Shewanella sp. Choline-02u-19]|nr:MULTISPECIES: heme lyase CcmF/NrfE family subunit [unclassified Shewanella]PKG74384.1 heme lyase NrfEFG subunit NrfE [Shewanella sp. GutCb]PKH57790.1 heme lyase NrfEFG subunit NrfE [Shewanella sp. Bg11-22]PKI29792.1 heme lyase NrfEFG subunit NrfE [Shewanella sp. Choline-02u-19]